MNLHDYQHCYVFTTSARDGIERNTCRAQVLSRCELINKETEDSQQFYLAKECIGEYMYQEGGITLDATGRDGVSMTQTPTSHVWSICAQNKMRQDKRFASHDRDISQVVGIGEKIKTFSGQSSYLTEYRFNMKLTSADSLKDPQQITDATLNSKSLVGLTKVEDSNHVWQAILEYPIPYMNVHPPESQFQVDVGPILFPDFRITNAPLISQLRLCYVLFNTFDQAEFVLLAPSSTRDDGRLDTLHFSEVLIKESKNEIFSLKT